VECGERPYIETNTSKEKGEQRNTFVWIRKHQRILSSSVYLRLTSVPQFTAISRYQREWKTQGQDQINVVSTSASSPPPLHRNGQSRTRNLNHDIFSRYIRSTHVEPVPSFERPSAPNTASERIYQKAWLQESRSVMFIFLFTYLHTSWYLHITYNAVSVDWACSKT
jgi:hypothetical protein